MDLYADLPLAKGASSAALDADGKLKTAAGGAGSSVWKTTAPAFVPQVMRNNNASQPAGRDKVVPPPINTKSASSVSMLPAALRSKSPHGTAASGGSSISTSPATAVKKASGISLAFKPASITRKPVAATPTSSIQSQPQLSSLDDKIDDAELRPRGIGFGFSTVTTVTTQVRIQKDDGENQQPVTNASSAATDSGAAASAHFFQSNYRDEYNPARPNSYEAYCEERLNKKKLEQVRRELERRQVEQEREGKLEREKLVRDIETGKAPAVDLPAAGRGRGMTMPAWMRKKMEETAAAKLANEVHAQQVSTSAAEVDQFEDAAPRTGLGFHSSGAGLGFSRPEASRNSRSADVSLKSAPPLFRDEFGREIKRDDVGNDKQNHKRGRDDGDGNTGKEGQNQQPQLQHDSNSRLNSATRDQADPSNSYKRQREHDAPQKPSSGCVILLQNMVVPGEVDDELQDEVKEECAEKYGPVAKCVIYEVKGVRVPPEQAVRIFVQFQRQSDAEKARLGLNARFFGGRKVQAAYYDEDKFRRLDLTA